jgi:flagellar hook-associated protein 2
MSTISFNGMVSGIDTSSMIDALMNAERLPLTRLQARRTDVQATQKAYTQLGTLMTTLQTAVKAFTASRAGAKRTATSSNATILTASAAASSLSASYQVNVTKLGTATRATSTAAVGTAITAATASGMLATLPLPGSVRAGSSSMVVDGTVVKVTVGDPATTSLQDVLDGIAGAVQAQVRQTAGSEAATVTAAVVDNRVELAIAGTANTHAIAFGVGGDTSNLLGTIGLSGLDGSAFSSSAPLTGRSALGVVRTSTTLDGAGMAALASTTTGTLTINGAAIAYDTTTDSLATVISRINASSAGVTASMDRMNDRMVLTSRSGGPTAIAIEDTAGNLAASLALGPGTTAAQALGTRAELTVDGRVVVADTNHVTTAIEGVSLDLLALGTSTVTVSADRAAARTALSGLVDAYNALANQLDTLTENRSGMTRGPLAGEAGVRGLTLGLRQLLTGASTLTGSIRSLADVGVTTGAIGAAKGTTNRLSFDEATFNKAMDANPTRVAELLGGDASVLKPVLSRLDGWLRATGSLKVAQDSITSILKDLDRREATLNDRLAEKQARYETKFATLEKRLAEMRTASGAITQQVNSMTNSD